MNNSNKVKADFLGMPYGTAMGRLRKQLMFKFAVELGYDNCYKCDKPIETVDELSIEHKEPWLMRSVEKFWDLDNIAFSHLRCNKPHTQNGGRRPVQAPEGKAWCWHCKQFLDVIHFNKRNRNKNSLREYCKKCQSIENRRRY
jgi:hypothetical protein